MTGLSEDDGGELAFTTESILKMPSLFPCFFWFLSATLPMFSLLSESHFTYMYCKTLVSSWLASQSLLCFCLLECFRMGSYFCDLHPLLFSRIFGFSAKRFTFTDGFCLRLGFVTLWWNTSFWCVHCYSRPTWRCIECHVYMLFRRLTLFSAFCSIFFSLRSWLSSIGRLFLASSAFKLSCFNCSVSYFFSTAWTKFIGKFTGGRLLL